MTLVELQNTLGQVMEEVVSKRYASADERHRQMETTQQVVSIAKQMINNADIILRTDKLVGENKLHGDSIQGLIR